MKKSFKEILGEVRLRSPNFESYHKAPRFEVQHLVASEKFLNSIDPKCQLKIDGVIKDASLYNDPKLLKKLTEDIWEFRIKCEGLEYRFLAFLTNENARRLMVTTHGFVKKTQKIPANELRRANEIRSRYMNKT